MAAPTTQFEADGATLTPLEREATFLQTVADDTEATLTVAGTSTAGRNIYRMDLGHGTGQTLFITALIHGNEPASREALLLWLRDLAYSTDPDVLDYLATHRIVALTNCSPDAFAAGVRSVPGVGDPNRDFYRLAIKETRVILGEFAKVRPHAALDAHEFLGGSAVNDYWGFPGGNPVVPPDIRDAAQDWFNLTVADTKGAGYPASGYYPWSGIMRAGMSTVSGVMHSVGLLNETNAFQPLAKRVAIQRVGFDTARKWHEENAARCTEVVERSRETARGYRGGLPLYTGAYFNDEPDPQIVSVSGYQLAPGVPFPAAHAQAHNIIVQDDGFVPLQQEAAWVLPTLCDPDSPDRVVAAARVPRAGLGKIVGMYAHTEDFGLGHVKAMSIHAENGVSRVALPEQ